MQALQVHGPTTLQQGMQLAGWVRTGGQAKQLIQGGEVLVNGSQETRRNRQLHDGDVLTLGERRLVIHIA